MVRNQQLYDQEYARAVEGKSRSLWGIFMSAFEDDYSRRSREDGARAGAADRLATIDGARLAPDPNH